jgi:hypothetical protein
MDVGACADHIGERHNINGIINLSTPGHNIGGVVWLRCH